jgi:hypothetical protein
MWRVAVSHRVDRAPCASLKVCSGCFDRIDYFYKNERVPACAPHDVEARMEKFRLRG